MIDLRCGDALEVLKGLPDACCDALVSDPPAGISFMNLAFDGNRGGRDQWIAWLAGIMAEARRCIRPGGYALVWALPRTSHWTAIALEDSGWAIRDSCHHIFATGFPKSRSCLKPSHEVWWLAKAPGPLQPLQIDAARVATGELGTPRAYEPCQDRAQWRMSGRSSGGGAVSSAGRWPPNLVLSHHPDCQPAGVRRVRVAYSQPMERTTSPSNGVCYGPAAKEDQPVGYADADGYETVDAYHCVDGCPVAELDRQAGPRPSGAVSHQAGATITDNWRTSEGRTDTHRRANDNAWPATTGNASRFFPTFGPDPADAVPFRYVSKASRRDRGEGNTHSTVKSTALMAWLCKLATPPGGVVLDCFAGSGSTGVACVREGFGFIGIEAEPQYVEIARRRIAHEQEQRAGPLFAGVGTAQAAAR